MSFQRLYEDKVSEEKLCEIVCERQDYKETLRNYNTYPYHYFLSPFRHDLFKWYPFKKEGSLLEIGAGYGQLTSFFTEKLKHVVAIEDSQSKCNIISKRAEDATVLLSDFYDIKLEEKFDYIILCNVFEYAKSFVKSKDPYVDYLNYLKGFLKEDGVIFLALSNRLGLKYFAGFKEEHTNQLFSGINGYENIDYVQTFSKSEISNILNDAGFSNYKFYYPYPNHEMPQIIHTDKLINTIHDKGIDRYREERIQFFEEKKINLTLSKENLTQYFSNSFLIEIKSSDKDYPTDDMDYIKIATDRKDEFNIYTIIWADGKVSKSPISPKANEHIKRMFEGRKIDMGKIKCLDCEIKDNSIFYDFLKQPSYEYLLLKTIVENDKNEFYKLIESFYEAMFYDSFESNEYATEEFLNIFKVKSDIKFHCHEKSNLDLIFTNIFIIDGKFIAIDYEWTFDFPIPLEFIFWRITNYILTTNTFVKKFTNIEEIFNHFNLDIGNIDLFKAWDNNFIIYIIDHPPYLKDKAIPLENIEKYDQLQNEIRLKNKEIKNKNRTIDKKDKEIKRLLNSNSWKITKPLRKFKSLLKK